MEVVLAACQGLGLALAAGILVAAALAFPLGRLTSSRPLAAALLVLAAAAGAVLFALSLETEVSTSWPGFAGGALAGALAAGIAESVLVGAAGRAEGTWPTLALLTSAAALALAGLSLVLPPVSLAAALALLALALGRRRRDARKYEGLRLLR